MKFLIIEDEMTASARLKRHVLSLRPQGACLAEIRGVEEAVLWFNQHSQDDLAVVFADIQLSDGISFEIFELTDVRVPVIFTTAYDQYVLQVFKVHTIDYLLKPIKIEQLEQALDKLDRISGSSESPALAQALAALPLERTRRRFVVKSGRAIRVVNASDISYFYSEHKITYVVCLDGKKYSLEFTLDQLETMLDPHEFHRANRQYIVSIQGLLEMQAYSRSRLKLILRPKTAHDVIVSTEKASHFKDWLQGNVAV